MKSEKVPAMKVLIQSMWEIYPWNMIRNQISIKKNHNLAWEETLFLQNLFNRKDLMIRVSFSWMLTLRDQLSEETIVFIEEIGCKDSSLIIITIFKFTKVFSLLGAKWWILNSLKYKKNMIWNRWWKSSKTSRNYKKKFNRMKFIMVFRP